MHFICLDIGNVLCHVNTNQFLTDLQKNLSISSNDAKLFLKRIQHSHDLGQTNLEDELNKSFNIKPSTVNKIIKLWNDCIIPNEFIIREFNDLIENYDLQIALLSNIGYEHANLMPQKLGHGDFFSNTITHFSCDVGARKPSYIYYQSFLLRHPEFNGCLYVDDLLENLEAGNKMGFNSFKMDLNEDNPIDAIESIKKILIF